MIWKLFWRLFVVGVVLAWAAISLVVVPIYGNTKATGIISTLIAIIFALVVTTLSKKK